MFLGPVLFWKQRIHEEPFLLQWFSLFWMFYAFLCIVITLVLSPMCRVVWGEGLCSETRKWYHFSGNMLATSISYRNQSNMRQMVQREKKKERMGLLNTKSNCWGKSVQIPLFQLNAKTFGSLLSFFGLSEHSLRGLSWGGKSVKVCLESWMEGTEVTKKGFESSAVPVPLTIVPNWRMLLAIFCPE